MERDFSRLKSFVVDAGAQHLRIFATGPAEAAVLGAKIAGSYWPETLTVTVRRYGYKTTRTFTVATVGIAPEGAPANDT